MAILKCIGDINDGKEKRDFISGAFLLIEETIEKFCKEKRWRETTWHLFSINPT